MDKSYRRMKEMQKNLLDLSDEIEMEYNQILAESREFFLGKAKERTEKEERLYQFYKKIDNDDELRMKLIRKKLPKLVLNSYRISSNELMCYYPYIFIEVKLKNKPDVFVRISEKDFADV